MAPPGLPVVGYPATGAPGAKGVCHGIVAYPLNTPLHGADKLFPWDRGCCWFSARDEVEGGKANNNRGYHTSHKILVESVTL